MIRYDPTAQCPNDSVLCHMRPSADGEWVRHDDVAALRAENETLRARVDWRPIETAPVYQQILLADMSGGNRHMFIGIIYPATGPGRATHWMPLPPLPNAQA